MPKSLYGGGRTLSNCRNTRRLTYSVTGQDNTNIREKSRSLLLYMYAAGILHSLVDGRMFSTLVSLTFG
jgi:hypothetical protein